MTADERQGGLVFDTSAARRPTLASAPPEIERVVQHRIDRLRSLVEIANATPRSRRWLLERELCVEARELLVPLGLYLPYSLCLLLHRHAEKPKSRQRRRELLDGIAACRGVLAPLALATPDRAPKRKAR